MVWGTKLCFFGVSTAEQSRREALSIKAADENVVYAGGAGLYEIDARPLTYRPVPNPLLAKQVVNALLIDGNEVWAGTYNGLVRYNRITHQAKLYTHEVGRPGSLSDNYVRDLLRDSEGRLWVTTRLGLNLFDPARETFIHYRHDRKRSVLAVWTGLILIGILPSGHSGCVHLEK